MALALFGARVSICRQRRSEINSCEKLRRAMAMKLSRLIPADRIRDWASARSGLHCTAILCLALAVSAIEACSSTDAPFNPLAYHEADSRPAVPAASGAQTPHESLSSLTDVRKPQSAQIDSFSDSVLSGELTYYFEDEGLPLVGAQSAVTTVAICGSSYMASLPLESRKMTRRKKRVEFSGIPIC
jgi:hypothetical protein